MKTIAPVRPPFVALLLLLVLALFSNANAATPDRQAVNPVIGDLSYWVAEGKSPAHADEDLRVRSHLAFVEAHLRTVDAGHLPAGQRARRAFLLDLLHLYWTNGVFPRNHDHAGERRPCFIDRDGRICAVGFLVEQTAGCAVAEAINARHQYADLLDMRDSSLDAWIAESGLSRAECAMIQPAYGWTPTEPNHNYITRDQAIASSGFIGLNVGLGAVNGLHFLKGNGGKVLPIVGIASGLGQAVMGALTMPEPVYNDYVGSWESNDSQRQLSMVNVGMGTATACIGVLNLLQRKQRPAATTAWNLYSAPVGRGTALGLGFTKQF